MPDFMFRIVLRTARRKIQSGAETKESVFRLWPGLTEEDRARILATLAKEGV